MNNNENSQNKDYSNEQKVNLNTNLMGDKFLPNSTTVLVLGILSIVFCWCYGFLGLILGIIALYLSTEPLKMYKENPEVYSTTSYNNLKAGRICAIIGTILSALFLLFIIIYYLIIGSFIASIPWNQLNVK